MTSPSSRVRWLTFASILLLSLGLLVTRVIATSSDPNAPTTIGADEIEVEVTTVPETIPLTHTPTEPIPEFIPTHEWQEVLPGQTIPPGLWVRMDVSTGIKVARLLPEDEINDAGKKLHAQRALEKEMALVMQEADEFATEAAAATCDPISDPSCQHQHHTPTIVHKTLPEPDANAVSVDEITPQSENALKEARQERLRLLKEHFYLKEDLEQMKQLLSLCIDQQSSVEQVLQALEYLEEYVHQIDNANDWAKIGGLDVALTYLQQHNEPTTSDITPPSPTSSDSNDTASGPPPPTAPNDLQAERLYNLQANAAWVLGTATQNNPSVQAVCRKEGAVEILTERYHQTMEEDARQFFENEPNPAISLFQLRAARLKLLSKLLYGLSALLRNNAANQARFHAQDLKLSGENLLLRKVNTDWKRCDLSGSSTNESPLHCVNTKEHVQLLKLVDNFHSKRLNLLHDFIVDHTVNSLESISKVTGKTFMPKPGVSDAVLFQTLVSERYCKEYADMVLHPSGSLSTPLTQALTQTQLTTRELSLAIMNALLSHKHADSNVGLCYDTYHATTNLESSLTQLIRSHDLWSAEAALSESSADEAADGLMKYHHELKEAVQKVHDLIK